MINQDRIVPITTVDLLSMYGLILKQTETDLAAVDATTTNGQFEVTEATTALIASEPVQTMDFATGVTSADVYFVPAYDYVGFTINGEAVTPAGDTVNPDGRTLYKAELATGAITITQIGF